MSKAISTAVRIGALRYFPLCFLLGATSVHPSFASSVDGSAIVAEAGKSYPAGTRIAFPASAVSFVIPTGWSGGLAEDAEVIVLGSERLGFAMIFRTVNMTEQDLVAELSEAQAIAHELIFEPVGPVRKTGDYLTASYQAGSLIGRALALLGPGQQGVVYFFGGPSDEAVVFEHTLADIAASTSFDRP